MENSYQKSQSILKKILPRIMIILSGIFAFCGVYIALICIYALPDGNVKPLEGSIFFASGSVILLFIIYYLSIKEKADLFKNLKKIECRETQIIFKENISDKLLKWLITIISVIFVLFSLIFPLICVYALPDKTVQPFTGALYFFCSALVIIAFIVTRKNSIKTL